ncbi:MAG: signal peptidase I [Ruminococcus sp.]|nr:signal peptidase I [Ruminococcus sp.]
MFRLKINYEVTDTPELEQETNAAADTPVAEERSPEIKLNKNEFAATVFDWLGSLFVALVVVLIVMTFGFRIIDVDGKSMEPTLIDSDKVLITDLFYTPHNGDIVIISHGEEYPKPLVKRVIATAGQELKLDYENNAVYVDGQKLDETYIQGMTVRGDVSEEELNGIVPEGKVFVMGDNRSISLDSRYKQIGFIDESYIIGKAQLDVIPHSYDVGGVPKLDFSKIRYVYS